MSDTTGDLLNQIWQHMLHLVNDILDACADKHLSIREMVELGRHGVALVATIVQLITSAQPGARTRLTESVRAQIAADDQETA
jgi:hypothetical protein